MDQPNLLGEFLRARRELATSSGLAGGAAGRRRVLGLRREEVAMLAGVSADYYARLEQGRDRHPSPEVLVAVARALDLDGDGLMHLQRLAVAPSRVRRRAPARFERVGPGLLRLLARWADTPAFITNPLRDVLACTPLAAAVHPGLVATPNMIRLLFLDDRERAMYPNWGPVAAAAVASLRAAVGTDADQTRLAELVGELVLTNAQFARLWARHDVRIKSTGTKRIVHPVVGALTLHYETFSVNETPGLSLTVYHTDPHSPDEDALKLLAAHTTLPTPDTGGTPRALLDKEGVLVLHRADPT